MGFCLTGIIIDGNFNKEAEKVLKTLKIKNFKLECESTFDEDSGIGDDSIISVGFYGTGTYLSTGFDLMVDCELLEAISSGLKIVSFYINETTSTYCFDYFENGEYLKHHWISYSDENIDQSDNFGELLDYEDDSLDELENIFKIISGLLGVDFYSIEEDEKILRFKIN